MSMLINVQERLNGLKIKLVAFDSMGVRSMATFVETSEATIFIDPGVALGPRRYGLPPHVVELKALEEKLNEIYRLIPESHALVITHYHRDHYLYRRGEEEYYSGKVIYAKNPYSSINPSQRIRAYVLYRKMGVEAKASRIIYSDGLLEYIGRVKLEFSNPLPHGECNSKLGWVIGVAIEEDDYRIVYASDAQGLLCKDSLDFVIKKPWNMLIVSGPATYHMKNPDPQVVMENLLRATSSADEKAVVVVDHHLLRDINYKKYLEYLRRMSRARVVTAAEYMGSEVKQLEAYRFSLWGLRSHEETAIEEE
ncbi:MAG: hypothetical protein QXI85_06525 [Desulfurococcaceae archaeon]